MGVREFRDRLTHYLAIVRGGDGLLVTDRDTPVAQVLPVGSPDRAAVLALAAEGVVEWSGGKPRGAPQRVASTGGLVSDLVAESRR